MFNNFLRKSNIYRITIAIHQQQLSQFRSINRPTSESHENKVRNALKFHQGPNAHKQHENTCKQQIAIEEVDNFPQHLLESLGLRKQDDLWHLLNQSGNSKTLLDIAACHVDKLEQHHYVQCVLLLWIFRINNNSNNIKTSSSNVTQEAIDERIYAICRGLQQCEQTLSCDELAACYLYLSKMRVDVNHPSMETLLSRMLQLVKNNSTCMTLTALSHLCVACNANGHTFYTPMVCAPLMPYIDKYVKVCVNAEEARLLAICLRNLQPLVDNELFNVYKLRVLEMCRTGVLNAKHGKSLMKILQMLNMPAWSLRNSALIRQLMLLLRHELLKHDSSIVASSLHDICHMFQFHKEPAALMVPLSEATEIQFRKTLTPDALVSYLPFADASRREPQIAQLHDMIVNEEHWQHTNAATYFFQALRELKVADVKMCDAYWERVAAELPANGSCSDVLLLRHCHNYMNFNNNLGGSYRYLPLEKKLTKLCMHSIVYDMSGIIPWKFSRLAAFVMGYGHTPHGWEKFPNLLLSKIINMSTQFSVSDWYTLSRGMRIALELRFRYEVPSLLALQLSTIDNLMVTCAERHLHATNDMTLSELNAIVHALANRKDLKKTVVYGEALNRYKLIDYNDLNSRTIREMCYNFNASNFLIPEALELMFSYISAEHEHVLGETVEKVLYSAYNLGYTPKSLDVFHHAAQILLRDFEQMRGLALLKACMSLCFYKALPEELINAVFCANFIKRIEDEIQICYSRATYPERVQNMVMQLNRTVCLDFPESNVPWFQQNYIEAHMSKKSMLKSRFGEEVKRMLFNLLEDEKYVRCNHVTPYGYQVDFVIHFDGDKMPMSVTQTAETTMLNRITKVAILLLKLDSFCENDFTALRGADSMKIKHLEMLGYKVLYINEHDWYSKYMQAPGAKTNYLKCLLQISS